MGMMVVQNIRSNQASDRSPGCSSPHRPSPAIPMLLGGGQHQHLDEVMHGRSLGEVHQDQETAQVGHADPSFG